MRGQAFLFPAIAKTAIAPAIVAAVLIRCFCFENPATRVLVYVLAYPALYILRSHYSIWQQAAQARRLGAIPVIRVRGRWPLNLDVLVDWAKSGAEEEVGRMLVLLSREYGTTYNTRVLGEDQIISLDPAVTQHVLVTDFDNFGKGPKFKDRAEDFFGDGIFNTDGERWKFHRQLTRPFFHHSHVAPETFVSAMDRFLSFLPTPDQPAINVQALLGKLALNTAISWMCGEDIGAMEPVSQEDLAKASPWRKACVQLPDALARAQRAVGRRVKIGTLWPLFELTGNPLTEPMMTIRAFFRPIIDRGLERKQARIVMVGDAAEAAARATLLDRLLDATDNVKLVEDQLINILVAARDTTTSLLTFLMYALALHPDTAKRVQDEILQVLPGGSTVGRSHLKKMPIARAFINETLRLFPPVPLNIRRSIRPSLLPSSPPLYMPANTSIIVATSVLQRSKAVWGTDAEDFNLDRWLEGGVSERDESKFQAWNIGPRMCLGQPFAMTAALTFLTLLTHTLRAPGQWPRRLVLASDAQPEQSRMPEAWKSEVDGDGRARGGRDRVWIAAEVVLAVKGGLWIRTEEDENVQD